MTNNLFAQKAELVYIGRRRTTLFNDNDMWVNKKLQIRCI